MRRRPSARRTRTPGGLGTPQNGTSAGLHWELVSDRDLALNGGDPVRTAPYPAWPSLAPGDLERVREVLETPHWGGSGDFVEAFEEVFAQFHDSAFGVAVCSGSMALELALHSVGLGPGDEVIVPAHSFIATAAAVSRVGAAPIFVDIEAATYNIDPSCVPEALSDRTKALIPVHFGGVVADCDKLGEIADDRGLLLIEDAAHAHGAEWFGTRAGGLGACGVFSFQNSKAMVAGEGGILVTSAESVAARARSITNAGRLPDGGWFEHFELGTNLRMTGIQAALLSGQLERLPEQIRLREANFSRFRDGLEVVEGLELQRTTEGASVQTRYIVPGRVSRDAFGAGRDELVQAVQAEGVPIRPFYPHPLYANPLYRNLPHRQLPCPVAEQASRDSFWLPLRLFMGTEEDAADAARAIAKVHLAFKARKEPPANGSAAG